MRTCLKNIKYIYYDPAENKFKYYTGNCYVQDGMISGFGSEENNFDSVVDYNGKLLIPMLCNLNCNLEDGIYYHLQSNWDTTKFASLENTMGLILENSNKEYYEELAPFALRAIVNQGTGLLGTRRCYKTLSNAPIYGLCSYPIGRSLYIKNYINQNLITDTIGRNSSPNIIHGFNVRNLYDNDDGSLSLVKNNLNKVKFISATIGLSELSQNLVKQKWLKDELSVLNMYDLLHSNTILFGCNVTTENELKRIKDCNASVVYAPLMARTLNVTPGNPLLAENVGVNWCLASGSIGTVASPNMIYVMQETARMFPALDKRLILKAATINPQMVMKNICGSDLLAQANFTVLNAPYNFEDADSAISYIFSSNCNDLNPETMICGNIVKYNEPDNILKYKEILKTYYKRFDEFLVNPNMFVNEVPQKP